MLIFFRRQVLYALTSSGKEQLLEVRYDSVSRPLVFEAASFASMGQSYDRFGNLEQWKWGDLSEAYKYDQNGRLTSVIRGNVTFLTYQYKEKFDMLPQTVNLGKGTFINDVRI